MEWIPENINDAGEFYRAYARRHYVQSDDNADGVVLANANLNMLKDMIPRLLRAAGFMFAPRIYMLELSGEAACRRVGIGRLPGHSILKGFIIAIPPLLLRAQRVFRGARHLSHIPAHHYFSRLLFQGLIVLSLKHKVTFTVPVTMKDFHKMV
jgi:hypothetical protein